MSAGRRDRRDRAGAYLLPLSQMLAAIKVAPAVPSVVPTFPVQVRKFHEAEAR